MAFKRENDLKPDKGKSHWHLIYKAAAYLESYGHFDLAKALKESNCTREEPATRVNAFDKKE
jgi:hypothetical protein